MPLFHLLIKAEMEGIAKLEPVVNNNWKFNIKSSGGHERNGITVSAGDEQEIEGSRGTANFIIRWDKGAEPSHIKLVTPKVKGFDGCYTKSGEWTVILAMECRGIEPVDWIPSVDFDAISNAGKRFEAIDMTDKEFSDYDEEADEAVSILNLEYRFERA